MSKYNPFSDFFENLPESDCEHVFSFNKIQRILGTNLPPTALIDRPWWANTRSSNHAKHWLKAGWKVSNVDFKNDRITFVRIGSKKALNKIISRNRYKNLKVFFKSIPSHQKQIALSFEEIAKKLGGSLPETAFRDRPWWANVKSSPQGASWVSAGWIVEKVFLKAKIVTFRQKFSNPLTSIPRYVKGILDGTSHLGQPAVRTIIDWIRFCKQVGWYFEATVLFERGGLDIQALTESEYAEVYEDYTICKRELNRYKEV